MLKVALVQRILAPYRAEVFRRLSVRPGIDLTVFHGRGTASGQWMGLERTPEVRTHRLIALAARLSVRDREYFLAFHPGLVPRLAGGRFDVILAEGMTNLPNNLPLAAWCRMTGRPLVIWDSGRYPGRPMGPARRMAEPMQRRILRGAAACVGYGESSVEYFRGLGIPEERIFVARNSLDLAPVQKEVLAWQGRRDQVDALRNDLGLPAGRVVIHVGSLHASKPLDPLLQACAALEKTHGPIGVLVAGDGPDRPRLEAMAASLGLKAARFLGHVGAGEGLAPYALMSGLAVYPGRATLGVVMLLGHGVPVVAARDRSPEQEAIQEGFNGRLIGANSTGEVERALADWLSGRPGYADADTIRQAAWERLSLDRMVDGLEQAIRHAARSGGRTAAHAVVGR